MTLGLMEVTSARRVVLLATGAAKASIVAALFDEPPSPQRPASLLLTHPDFAAQLGRHGHEHSKENFLLTSNMKRWLILFQQMLGLNKPIKVT